MPRCAPLARRYYSNEYLAQVAGVSLAEFNAMELDFLFRLDFRARCTVAELAAGLREMEALASGHGAAGTPAPPPPALPALSTAEAEAAAAAAMAASAATPEVASRGCCSAETGPVAAAAAALVTCHDSAAAEAEGEDSCSDATTVAALCPSPAYGGCEEQGPARGGADPALPWASATATAAPGKASDPARLPTVPPRRSKKRCSMEAQHVLCGGAEERARLAEPDCRA